MIAAVICEKFGWTYKEYLEQPDWLIQTFLMKEDIVARYIKSETKKAKRP